MTELRIASWNLCQGTGDVAARLGSMLADLGGADLVSLQEVTRRLGRSEPWSGWVIAEVNVKEKHTLGRGECDTQAVRTKLVLLADGSFALPSRRYRHPSKSSRWNYARCSLGRLSGSRWKSLTSWSR